MNTTTSILLSARLLSVLLVLVVVGGCASAPEKPVSYVSDPSYSEAMNVMLAAGLIQNLRNSSIKDVPREKIEQGVRHRDGTDFADVGFSVSNVLNRPPGVGLGFAGTMSLLSMLEPQQHEKAAFTRGIAWIPKSAGDNPLDAIKRLNDMLINALESSIQEILVPDGFTYEREVRITHLRNKEEIKSVVFFIGGNGCSNEGLTCVMRADASMLPMDTIAPDFLGGYQAYQVVFLLASIAKDDAFLPTDYPVFPALATFQSLSARLPEWIYLYLPPLNSVSHISIGLTEGFLKYPVILNQGKALYFIEPERMGKKTASVVGTR